MARLMVRDMETATPEALEQDIVALAKAAELNDRIARISKWVNEGHIVVDAVHKENRYDIFTGSSTFSESKDDFPSTSLVANIALAVECGATRVNEKAWANHMADQMRYQIDRQIVDAMAMKARYPDGDRVYYDEFSEIKEELYHKVARLTAPVSAKSKVRV